MRSFFAFRVLFIRLFGRFGAHASYVANSGTWEFVYDDNHNFVDILELSAERLRWYFEEAMILGVYEPLSMGSFSRMQTCAATSPNSLEIYFRTGWWYLQTGSGLRCSGQKIKKKSKMAVLGLSGHLLSRYIVHLGLKNTPGLIFEVPRPQNPVKKLILSVLSKICRRFSGLAAGQVCILCPSHCLSKPFFVRTTYSSELFVRGQA